MSATEPAKAFADFSTAQGQTFLRAQQQASEACEGGVFTTALAALESDRVNTLALTITPTDFHADTVEGRLGHGFINVWTRSLSSEDVDRFTPTTSHALELEVDTTDYKEMALPGGHVGVFVGGRSQQLFAPAVASFLTKHDQAAG
jgi:hypothetical protein